MKHKYHLQELETYATILPAVNQIDVHPFFQRQDIVSYCQSKGIIIEAYSPLTRGKMVLYFFYKEMNLISFQILHLSRLLVIIVKQLHKF